MKEEGYLSKQEHCI